jgi:hypothetical protein
MPLANDPDTAILIYTPPNIDPEVDQDITHDEYLLKGRPVKALGSIGRENYTSGEFLQIAFFQS